MVNKDWRDMALEPATLDSRSLPLTRAQLYLRPSRVLEARPTTDRDAGWRSQEISCSARRQRLELRGKEKGKGGDCSSRHSFASVSYRDSC